MAWTTSEPSVVRAPSTSPDGPRYVALPVEMGTQLGTAAVPSSRKVWLDGEWVAL